MGKGLLTNIATLLVGVEATYGTNPGLSVSDVILCAEPKFTPDISVLERNYSRPDISPMASVIGRILSKMTFTCEVKGNSLQHNGSSAPILGRLLRGCGFSQTAISGAGTLGAVANKTGNTVNPSWATTNNFTLRDRIKYTATCVLAGASATAKMRLSGYSEGIDQTLLKSETFSGEVQTPSSTVTIAVNATNPLSVTYTIGGTAAADQVIKVIAGGFEYAYKTTGSDTLSTIATAIAALMDAHALLVCAAVGAVATLTFAGTAAGTTMTSAVTVLTLGGSTTTIGPTWSGSLVIGDSWSIICSPTGFIYQPVSDNFDSISLEMNKSGVKHVMTGARGTFTITAQAGQYATLQFEFTGLYTTPYDETVPSVTFDETLPPQVELSLLNMDGFGAIVDTFSFTMGNNIVPRMDTRSAQGYNGVRISGRNPTGGMDPEAELMQDHHFWQKLDTARAMEFSFRVGQTAGNVVWFKAPAVQYTGMTYQDRDNIVTYDCGLKFNRVSGNDEFLFIFA